MASSLDSARAGIEAVLAASSETIIWPGAPVTPPTTGVWLQPHILWGDGFHSTKNGRNQIVGVVQIDVFGPAGAGTGAVFTAADGVRDLFNRGETGSVRFNVPSGPVLVPTDTRWIQAAVTIPFVVEEVVT